MAGNQNSTTCSVLIGRIAWLVNLSSETSQNLPLNSVYIVCNSFFPPHLVIYTTTMEPPITLVMSILRGETKRLKRMSNY